MRIVLVGTAWPLRGGIAHYVALLHRALSRRGHAVEVLSFRRQYPSLLFPGRTQKDEGPELVPVGARALLDSVNPVSWIRAAAWLKRVRPDAVVFKYWMPFFAPCYAALGFALKRVLRVPIVYLCDNVLPHEKKPLDGWLTSLALRYPDAYIVQSSSVRRDLAGLKPGARVAESPHPVYDFFPPAASKRASRRRLGLGGGRLMLFFGYVRPYKGLHVLVEAMPAIAAETGARLVVCGEFYEGRAETEARVRELGLGPAVTIRDGFVPNEAVADWFSAADVVVLPYVSATQSGIVQIAYRYGRPVIATTVGGLPETVSHGRTGFLVPPEDPAALARAAIRFFSGPVDRFGPAIRAERARYSWDRMAETVENLAGSLAREKALRAPGRPRPAGRER